MKKIREYDPNRPKKILSDKHRNALIRNFRIFQLRGLYHQTNMIHDEHRRDSIKFFIDQEITDLGAESEVKREQHRQALYLTSYVNPWKDDEEIPF